MTVTAEDPLPLVSIVIVNYNGGELLQRCLRSVMAQPYRPVEILLVDNGSSDGSVEEAARNLPDLRVIRNPDNRGFARANNQGVAAARGAYVVLLNNDTEVEAGWIPGLMKLLAEPGVGVVTSLVTTDGVPREYYTMNGTLNYLGYNIMRHFTDLSRVFFAGGASLMFRPGDIGVPFPAEYFLYHEDVHLSWRLRLQGWDVRMAQDSVVHHRGSATTRRQPGRLITFCQERNRILNSLLMYERRTLLALIPYLMADACATLALSLVAGRKSTRGILAAWWWILGHPGWILRERRELQRSRRVPDRAILSLMSWRVVEGDARVAAILNRFSRVYAGIAGLAP